MGGKICSFHLKEISKTRLSVCSQFGQEVVTLNNHVGLVSTWLMEKRVISSWPTRNYRGKGLFLVLQWGIYEASGFDECSGCSSSRHDAVLSHAGPFDAGHQPEGVAAPDGRAAAADRHPDRGHRRGGVRSNLVAGQDLGPDRLRAQDHHHDQLVHRAVGEGPDPVQDGLGSPLVRPSVRTVRPGGGCPVRGHCGHGPQLRRALTVLPSPDSWSCLEARVHARVRDAKSRDDRRSHYF